jgi:hypothetical protein
MRCAHRRRERSRAWRVPLLAAAAPLATFAALAVALLLPPPDPLPARRRQALARSRDELPAVPAAPADAVLDPGSKDRLEEAVAHYVHAVARIAGDQRARGRLRRGTQCADALSPPSGGAEIRRSTDSSATRRIARRRLPRPPSLWAEDRARRRSRCVRMKCRRSFLPDAMDLEETGGRLPRSGQEPWRSVGVPPSMDAIRLITAQDGVARASRSPHIGATHEIEADLTRPTRARSLCRGRRHPKTIVEPDVTSCLRN